jgi:hypothetical protein
MKDLSEHGQCPCRDSNRIPTKYKLQALVLELTCYISNIFDTI